MTTVFKLGEKIPNTLKYKNRIFSYQWAVKYQDKGITKTERYKTENKGVNARNAVLKRFENEFPNVKLLNITCD